MDHLEVANLVDARQLFTDMYNRFISDQSTLWDQDWSDKPQAEVDSVLTTLYSYLDLNHDSRLYMSELCGWMIALTDHHFTSGEADSRAVFEKIAVNGQPISWHQLSWTCIALTSPSYFSSSISFLSRVYSTSFS